MNGRWPAVVLGVVLLLAGLFFGMSRREQNRNIVRNSKATVALCALRADLDSRIASSTVFLRAHPNGIPGIPASLIQQGLLTTKRTRKALSVLDCKEAP